ncbi:putative bifunctional diguanylate cyclase/phosphodiesterase [Litoribrevibacter euphylliae]|uniref:Bifunctional diguanylate cyclase/phosphodiesterase n=1 Tax=Litoribrevibacter euphylliae TaxID=1834034 RepID=A0ABV7HJR8_9GAMM
MSSRLADSKFISLKFQVASAFALVASLIVLVFAVATYIWSTERLDRLLEAELIKYQTNFKQLISMTGDGLVDVADQVMLLASTEALTAGGIHTLSGDSAKVADPDLTALMRAIDLQWDNLNLFGQLDAIVLLGDRAEVLAQKGQVSMQPVTALLEWVPQKSRPESLIHCSDDCRLYIGVPVLLDGGKRYVMVIAQSISDVVAAMGRSFNVELALGVAGESSYLGRMANWNVGLMSSSSQVLTNDVLNYASRTHSLKELINAGQQLLMQEKAWALWALEINQHGDVLLVASDLTEEQQSSRQLMMFSLLFALLAGMLSVLVGVTLLWRPVQRIALHNQTLPLLADGEYELVRSRLAPDHGSHYNEVDQLDVATVDLSRRLEFLSREVELRTGELERLAMYDTLTHLPNRSLFVHELREAVNDLRDHPDESVGLVFLDLDGFKRVNETLGHMAGDNLLVQMSRRIQTLITRHDTLCRLGGDEFAIICRHLKDPDDIHVFLKKVLAEFRKPVEVDQRVLTITASIGVVCCDNPDSSPEDLTRQADMAMYAAKDEGKNSFHFFNDQMLIDISKALELESELQTALDNDQFCLFLQPKYCLESGVLDGFEALVRWRHPEKGLIMPNHFIPQMEQGEMIFQLGRWVISHGLNIIRGLERSGLGQFKLAVNLSARQFCDDKLVDHLSACLQDMPGDRLELEITENVLIHNSELAASVMKQANDLGVTVALDDFGTGYSSLSYLRQLPVDVIKLDRSFIAPTNESEESRHIVTSVIDLAHKLNKYVVAEGVETQEHLLFLKEHNCDSAQGFLLSRPIDEHELPDVLAKGDVQKKASNYLNADVLDIITSDETV